MNIIGDITFGKTWTVFGPIPHEATFLATGDLQTVSKQIHLGGEALVGKVVTPWVNQFDLRGVLGDPPHCFKKSAYVFVKLEAAEEGEVTLGFGADYRLEAWLNGTPVFAQGAIEDGCYPPCIGNILKNVQVREGSNVLAVRYIAGKGSAVLALGGPRELRTHDVRSLLDRPSYDPVWSENPVQAAPGKKEHVEIGSRRELFVDDFLIDGLAGDIGLRLHHPVPQEVVQVFGEGGKPWEASIAYPTVFEDEGKIRLYYSSRPTTVADESESQFTGFMESEDGIHFTRPGLGLFEFQGSKKNNIIWHGTPSHNFSPFKDLNPAATDDQRYKAVGYHPEGRGLGAFVSPDGIHWNLMTSERIITKGNFDSHNVAFWDPIKEQYVCYYRACRGAPEGDSFGGVRDIMTCTSEDFVHWSEAAFIHYADGRSHHMYTNAIRPYHRAPHFYVGTPARFMPARRKGPEHPDCGVSDGLFMSSRDGTNFQRWLEGFVRPSMEPEAWTDRNNYPAWGMVQLSPGEISLYWTEHYKHPNPRIRRGTLRTDGFVSLHVGGDELGEMLTRPLVFSGERLEVNYATSAAGAVMVEMCDESGKALEGFSFNDAEVLYGNEIDHCLTWRGSETGLGRWAGRPVRLRVRMSDADLYAFQFIQSF